MSWDLYVGEQWVGNFTHNTNHMIRSASVAPREVPEVGVAAEVLFRAPVLGACWNDFDGRPAREAALFAEDIALELERDPARYEAMNPENGWGSRAGLLEFLGKVREACDEDPAAVFKARG